MRCSVAYTNCCNICSVLWCLVIPDKVSDEVLVLWLLHLYEHAAFIFTVVESGSGGCRSDWQEKVCRLYRRLHGFWLVRDTEIVEGIVFLF
jgi:hypothetical protein